jgi:hypothetical protein
VEEGRVLDVIKESEMGFVGRRQVFEGDGLERHGGGLIQVSCCVRTVMITNRVQVFSSMDRGSREGVGGGGWSASRMEVRRGRWEK